MKVSSEELGQLELLPSAQPHRVAITPELIESIRCLPTLLRAWNLAQDLAVLEDKPVYTALEIDPSHWSKIRNGRASPPADERFSRYMDVVQNEIPLVWLVESRGYDWTTLRKHRSEEGRRIAELEVENADLRRSLKLMWEARPGR